MRSLLTLGVLPVSVFTLLIPSGAAVEQNYGGVDVNVTKEVPCVRHSRDGDTLSVHYRGTLQSNGNEFDSSYPRGSPFIFKLGTGVVIKGWDLGLSGMCIGEARRLTIPPSLGYGHRDMHTIPPDSTLIFETELMAIEGVEPEDEAIDIDEENEPVDAITSESTSSDEVIEEKEDDQQPIGGGGDKKKPDKGSPNGPDNDEGGSECKLLGPFALLIQGALGLLAILSLVVKRYRERPRRPVKVWAFDVSKQVLGSMLLHLANLLMSMFASGDLDLATQPTSSVDVYFQDDDKPNPCSFYLLNLAIDTTIGIPILVLLLRILHGLFAYTPMAKPAGSLRSGNYGSPPKYTWWLKQSLIYFIGLLGMKFCVFALFTLFPWIGWVGDWALRWTEGREWVQITFVMLIFPLIMNALQYYIIDSVIKDKEADTGYEVAETAEHGGVGEEEEGLINGRRDSEDEEEASAVKVQSRTKEANVTPIPVENNTADRVGSSGSSSGDRARKDI